jgi:dTDP-glucose 4,6-dehydratase
MKLLVTGGAGFIGSNFIIYWLKNHPQDQIVNFDKLTYAGNLENLKEVETNSNYSFVKGDICNAVEVEAVMSGVDTVVHFAAESHVDRSIMEPASFVLTNVVGTQVLLDAALKKTSSAFTIFLRMKFSERWSWDLQKSSMKTPSMIPTVLTRPVKQAQTI